MYTALWNQDLCFIEKGTRVSTHPRRVQETPFSEPREQSHFHSSHCHVSISLMGELQAVDGSETRTPKERIIPHPTGTMEQQRVKVLH
jgi:hypothetical protein